MPTTAKNTNTATTETEYVDDRQLAVRTSLSRAAWQTFRSRGKGPPYYKVGKRCLYKWHEVEAWIDAQRTEPKAS